MKETRSFIIKFAYETELKIEAHDEDEAVEIFSDLFLEETNIFDIYNDGALECEEVILFDKNESIIKFERISNLNLINGTSYQGDLNISYDKLCNIFGEPIIIHEDGHKIDCEWAILINNKVVATIYNYKNGINYYGERGTPTVDITDWHIGGFSHEAAELINKIILEYGLKIL